MNKNGMISLSIYFGVYIVLDVIKLLFTFDFYQRAAVLLTVIPIMLVITLILLRNQLNKGVKAKKASLMKSLLAIISGFILMVIGQKLMMILWTNVFHIQNGTGPDSENLLKSIPLLLLVQAILGPILEEMIFRGTIQRYFHTKFHPLVSIALTSLLFAGWHMTLAGFPQLFWTSIVLSTSYYYTNRLSVPITIHIMLNTMIGLVSLYG